MSGELETMCLAGTLVPLGKVHARLVTLLLIGMDGCSRSVSMMTASR